MSLILRECLMWFLRVEALGLSKFSSRLRHFLVWEACGFVSLPCLPLLENGRLVAPAPPRAAGQIQPRPWDVAEPLAGGPPTRAAL